MKQITSTRSRCNNCFVFLFSLFFLLFAEKNSIAAPLHDAAESGDVDKIVSLFQEPDFNINVKENHSGMTALMSAAQHGRTNVVEELVTAGADLDLKDERGRTALMFAAHDGRARIVEELITAKADLDLQDRAGVTALMSAVDQGRMKVVEELVAAGADLNLKDRRSGSVRP
jgi:ankyrin repeat protein